MKNLLCERCFCDSISFNLIRSTEPLGKVSGTDGAGWGGVRGCAAPLLQPTLGFRESWPGREVRGGEGLMLPSLEWFLREGERGQGAPAAVGFTSIPHGPFRSSAGAGAFPLVLALPLVPAASRGVGLLRSAVAAAAASPKVR